MTNADCPLIGETAVEDSGLDVRPAGVVARPCRCRSSRLAWSHSWLGDLRRLNA